MRGTTAGWRVALLALSLCALWAGGLLASESTEPTYAGKPLVAALKDLRARGINLIFSSELVREEMVVQSEPEGPSLHRKLQQILGPHGLEAQIGPRGSVLVVKRNQAPILVTLESPTPQQAVFGTVEIRADVSSREIIDHVELRVDGRSVGVIQQPPYRAFVDVGEENQYLL